MELSFKNRVVLITGGASGIGFAVAKSFLEKGAVTVIWDIDEPKLKEIQEKYASENLLTCTLDISDEEKIKIGQEKIIDLFKRLDILVNNAGITQDNLFLRMKKEEFQKVIEINLYGTFLCTKSAVSVMMKQRFGRIINISSVIGIELGNIGQVNYAASKSAIIGMTKTLAIELARWNITVNSICPGFIDTPLTQRLSQDRKEKLLTSIPLGRLGKPEEVAYLTLFLSSDYASYITGQNFIIDGGLVITSGLF